MLKDNYDHEIYEGITVLDPLTMDSYTDASADLYDYVVNCILSCNWYEYKGKLWIEESDAYILGLRFDDDETIWWPVDGEIVVNFIPRILRRFNEVDGFYHA